MSWRSIKQLCLYLFNGQLFLAHFEVIEILIYYMQVDKKDSEMHFRVLPVLRSTTRFLKLIACPKREQTR